MADKSWKRFERTCAAAFGAKRYPANMGGALDFEGEHVIGQCKEVRNLSLEQLTTLAEYMEVAGCLEKKLGVVCTKVRRGRGKSSEPLVTLTLRQFTEWLDVHGRA